VIDPDVGLLVCGACALLFATASWHKARAPAEFAAILRSYQLAPRPALWALRWLIPAVELATAVGLLMPFARSRAALAGATLLLVYAAAIAVNLVRRRLDLDCGCSVRHARRPIARWMVIRNVLLAAALAATTAPWSARPLGVVDAITVGGGVAIATLLYAAIDRLLGEVVPRAAARHVR